MKYLVSNEQIFGHHQQLTGLVLGQVHMHFFGPVAYQTITILSHVHEKFSEHH